MCNSILEGNKIMKEPKIINIVSGKGGTGKSLLCAVLGRLIAQEGAKVLLADFDLFVRGLSHLHYLFIKEQREITKNITVSDFFEITANKSDSETLAKERFYEVDILPAVSQIEEQLNYLEIEKETIGKVRRLFKRLRDEQYDYIIIDNRAGVDELILETSVLSDITISVTESDPIARTTNENLLRHLNSIRVGKVYTIMNKVKFLKTFSDYEKSMEQIRSDFNILGQIPFDIDLFEKFGTNRFWDDANSTRYAYTLADTWNKLSKRESYSTLIDMGRFHKFDLWPSKKGPVLLNKLERLSFLLGIVCIIAYAFYDRLFMGGFNIRDILLLYAVIMLMVPAVRRLFPFKRD